MHTGQLKVGHDSLIIETGKLAKQADGSVIVRFGETVVLVTACYADRARRYRFSSFDGRLSREHLCLWQNSWRLLQAGRKAARERSPDQSIDRPAAPPIVFFGLES